MVTKQWLAEQSQAVQDLMETLQARGSQYGQPDDDKVNLRGATLVGVDPIVGAYIRANDKHIRLRSLLHQAGGPGPLRINAQLYAQMRDQMLDIAGYSIKQMELLDETREFWEEVETVDTTTLGATEPTELAVLASWCCYTPGCPVCGGKAEEGCPVGSGTPSDS